ncbi:hypothetical protein [Brevibacillus fulvus]|uniref:Hydrolase n=1 Tax=Brevibacillus fulvus TaxID=1125967 RepID=A0A938Y4X6_9BACL|nr:hypothetical protein [Brevibacillus fulvus]MBM7592011.1 hypothetical protein [Brevibacillus fulvus]
MQAGTKVAEIREATPGSNSTYDFEIEASPEQALELRKMFQEAFTVDFDSFLHGHVLFTEVGEDDNKTYDSILRDAYNMLYTTGTVETKTRLEQMGIVDQFKLNQQNRPD